MGQEDKDSVIYLYYGTKNLELDFKYKIDPEFDGNKKFEFGNGFYLTPNKELAESYIRHGLLVDSVKPEKRPSLKEMINGISGEGHLHIYEFNCTALLNDGKVKWFEGTDEYRKVLEETLNGYNENTNYRPDRDATWGPICGQFWDDYWEKNNFDGKTLSNKDLINKCVEQIERFDRKKEKQICIHRKNIGKCSKNILSDYLKKVDCKKVKF